jgi:hypothetical protein
MSCLRIFFVEPRHGPSVFIQGRVDCLCATGDFFFFFALSLSQSRGLVVPYTVIMTLMLRFIERVETHLLLSYFLIYFA